MPVYDLDRPSEGPTESLSRSGTRITCEHRFGSRGHDVNLTHNTFRVDVRDIGTRLQAMMQQRSGGYIDNDPISGVYANPRP